MKWRSHASGCLFDPQPWGWLESSVVRPSIIGQDHRDHRSSSGTCKENSSGRIRKTKAPRTHVCSNSARREMESSESDILSHQSLEMTVCADVHRAPAFLVPFPRGTFGSHQRGPPEAADVDGTGAPPTISASILYSIMWIGARA